MIFEWRKEYSMNSETIDNQHKHFFAIANTVYDAAEKNEKEKTMRLLSELFDYSLYHFKTEEDYFKTYKYPEADLHIKIHNIYREYMLSLLEKIKKNESDSIAIIKEAALYASNWLGSHILVMDKKYAEYFKSKGYNF